MENISERTTKVGIRLLEWSKEDFGQVESNLMNLDKKLQWLNELPLDDTIQQQIEGTKKKIVEWRHHEEIFW